MRRTIKEILRILNKNQIRGFLLLFIGAFIIAIFDTILVAMMSPFMTLLMNSSNIISNLQKLKFLSLGLTIAYLLRGLLKILYNFVQAKLISEYRIELSTKLYELILRKPYSYHLEHNTAETQRLVSSDVENCFVLINNLSMTISALFVGVGIFIALFTMDRVLTLSILFIGIFFVWLSGKVLKKIIAQFAEKNFGAVSEMNKWVSQAIGGLKTILVKKKQDYFISKYKIAASDSAIARSNYAAIDSVPKIMIDTLCMILVFGTMYIELIFGKNLNEQLPLLATFAVAAMRLIPVAGQVSSTLNYGSFYAPSIDAIYEVIYHSDENSDSVLPEQNHIRIEKCEIVDSVRLKDISFKFDNTTEELYRNLNLSIPAKKSVAFVGTTGSGKTTLADIILGLHKPQSGKVFADGIDINKENIWWSKMLGYIPQHIYLCDDSIRANVAFGEDKEIVDDKWIWECLERAQLSDYVKTLPEQLDTIVGENGIRMSGGQRQRLGIARALYGKPQFLVMDEATSALDAETEKAIVESINELANDMTLLIIAHRVTTIENCDYIYRIEKGKAVLEKGDKT